jgi:hypothetical protein
MFGRPDVDGQRRGHREWQMSSRTSRSIIARDEGEDDRAEFPLGNRRPWRRMHPPQGQTAVRPGVTSPLSHCIEHLDFRGRRSLSFTSFFCSAGITSNHARPARWAQLTAFS